MARAQLGETAVAYGDERAAGGRLEPYLHMRLLSVREVDATPLELEQLRRSPKGDAAVLEGARPGGQFVGLEQSAAETGLEAELARRPGADTKRGASFPPQVDLAGEHVECKRRRHLHQHADRGAVTGHAHRFLSRRRSACALNESSCKDQNRSTSSSQRRSSPKGCRRSRYTRTRASSPPCSSSTRPVLRSTRRWRLIAGGLR